MKYDVAIVGAGLTGLSLAVALAGAGRRVAVVDARGPAAPARPAGDDGFDQRIYAVSPASAAWLAQARVWQALDAARISPVHDMQVYGDAARDLAPGLALSAYRAGIGELCTIVEEAEMARVLEAAAGFAPQLDILRPVVAQRLVLEDAVARIELEGGTTVEAALVVAADGGNSWARAQAGIEVDNTEYGQTAVVANFRCERPHRQCAYQWFRVEEDGTGGVLAWLPLPGDRFSVVWSASLGVAARLMEEPETAFTARVAAAGMHALGELQCIGARGAFPLRNRRARQLAATRFVLVGDAAHVLHPLAGQGLNLGFGDCAALYRALDGARDCGDRLRLRGWERERKTALLEMHAVTHGMARLFGASHPLLRAVRNAGLNLGGRIPVLPKLLVQAAIG